METCRANIEISRTLCFVRWRKSCKGLTLSSNLELEAIFLAKNLYLFDEDEITSILFIMEGVDGSIRLSYFDVHFPEPVRS